MKKTERLFKCGMILIAFSCLAYIHTANGGNGKGGGKGGGNNTGDVGGNVSGAIYTQVEFDDTYRDGGELDNALVGDGLGPYVYGEDLVETAIGRNRSIQMDFNTHQKKASIRKLRFPNGFPVIADPTTIPNECDPLLDVGEPLSYGFGEGPNISNANLEAADAAISISGEDHDDTPFGVVRYVNGYFTFKDDDGETWIIAFGRRPHPSGSYFSPCGSSMVVERRENLDSDGDGSPDDPGISQWEFYTEDLDDTGTAPMHVGYLYRDNRPPHTATEFWGLVELPFSGIIESLTDETATTIVPDDSTPPPYPAF